jgi:subtilisin family serine protease
VRSLVKTTDGNQAIVSFGPNLTKLGYEPQNPPLVLSKSVIHRSSMPLLALVDTGVNYNLPTVQDHLALNSEGQLIGYDFWDDDDRPFDKDPRKNIFFPLHHGTSVFSVLTQNLGDLKTAIYRFPANDMCRFADLIEHANRTGVRIINLSMGSNSAEDWECFYESAKQHIDILFVVSAGNGGFNIDTNHVFPASFDLENMVVVTSSDLFGHLPRHSNYGIRSVDFVVSAEQVDVFDHRGAYSTTGGSSYAAPMVAALAARFLAKNKSATTRDIVTFLESRAIKKGKKLVKFGWISDPSDDFKF